MGLMYPKNCTDFKNKAEEFVYNFLKVNLPDKFICYYNYFIGERETDFCILVPELGFVILEVKGWDGSRIINVIDNEKIEYLNSNNEIMKLYSPLKQCREYCFKLNKKVKKEKDINIFVAPIVCYPNMPEKTFHEKSLDLISSCEVTLLKEDFENSKKFMNTLLNKISHVSRRGTEVVNEIVFNDLRTLFETDEKIYEEKSNSDNILGSLKTPYYSKLIFLPRTLSFQTVNQIIRNSLKLWKIGVKILILSEHEGINKVICEQLKQEETFSYLEKYKDFQIYDHKSNMLRSRIFHLEIFEGKYSKTIEQFEVVDGATDDTDIDEVLVYYDEITDFNLTQYKLEHANPRRHILVSAGAGTGKTYSMISRISYLVYYHKYTPEKLVESIFMITFTNEAAKNMKNRLKEYFSNFYILTENVFYLAMIEIVSIMNISTMHSLVKKIIQKYSVYLGVGISLKIESGVYERREMIVKELNKLVENNDIYLNCAANYEKYELIKSVENLLNKFEKRNIDLLKSYNFGIVQGNQEAFQLIMKTAENVQKLSIEEAIKNSKVHLSNLMIYLDRILDQLEVDSQVTHAIQYLFIDEFQDSATRC